MFNFMSRYISISSQVQPWSGVLIARYASSSTTPPDATLSFGTRSSVLRAPVRADHVGRGDRPLPPVSALSPRQQPASRVRLARTPATRQHTSAAHAGSMAKGGKGAKGSSKDERRAKKASANRVREHRRESRRALDRSELAQFAVLLKGNNLLLREVERDGNCFFRSLADQIEDCEHNHAEYRAQVMDYVERHREDFEPFFSFGEGEDEEDADFSEYIARMRLDGEWAGNYEIIAAARALDVHIMVHQFKMPAYRTEASKPDAPVVHVSYHDGDHYNSVRDPAGPGSSTAGKPRATGARSEAASPEAEAEASAEASALSESMGGLSIGYP